MSNKLVVVVLLVLLIGIVVCDSVQARPYTNDTNYIQNYLVADMVSRGLVNPSATVTWMEPGCYEAYLEFSDPDNLISGTNFRITVNYEGKGTPILSGGFE